MSKSGRIKIPLWNTYIMMHRDMQMETLEVKFQFAAKFKQPKRM